MALIWFDRRRFEADLPVHEMEYSDFVIETEVAHAEETMDILSEAVRAREHLIIADLEQVWGTFMAKLGYV